MQEKKKHGESMRDVAKCARETEKNETNITTTLKRY